MIWLYGFLRFLELTCVWTMMCTWWVDGEALLCDVAGTQAVVQWAWGAGDGHLNALTIQVDHSKHFWQKHKRHINSR